jgi:agmatinase
MTRFAERWGTAWRHRVDRESLSKLARACPGQRSIKSMPKPSQPQFRTVLPDARVSPRFAGIPTFCRYPRLQDVVRQNLPVDWAIYGVPYDSGVTYRPGARFGPRAIRLESQYVKRYSIEHDVDVCQVLSLADAGDSPVSPYDLTAQADVQHAFASTLGDPSCTRLFAVGGDHSIAFANLRVTRERFAASTRGLAVIHFDSHLDTVDQVWGHSWGHASVFRRAIDAKLIDPARMLSIGVKGPLNAAADLGYAQDHGVTVLTREALAIERHKAGPAGTLATIKAFRKRIGAAPVYVTFDIDCIDPAFAPGTGTPSVGGLCSSEAFRLLRSLVGMNVVGADVVEVLPDRDPGGLTALLAAHIIFEIIALDAARRFKL